jgi:hypothetical protein
MPLIATRKYLSSPKKIVQFHNQSETTRYSETKRVGADRAEALRKTEESHMNI